MTNVQQINFSKEKLDFVKELRLEIGQYFETNNITKYGNVHIFFKSLIMVACYLTPFFLMLTGVINTFWVIYSGWLLMGVGMAGIGMGLMHDANHGSLSKNNAVNKWMGKSLYLLGGYPINWKFQHNTLHHGYTNIDGHDEDIDPAGILRFSPHKPLYAIHRFQHWYAWFLYGLMTLSWVVSKDFVRLAKYRNMNAPLNNSKTYSRLLVDLVISKIIYFSIFLAVPIIFLPLPWYLVVAGFVSMHFVSGLILGAIFQAAHVMPSSEYPLPDDEGNLDNNWAIHQLITTTDFSPKSRIFSWFIGGLNYQVEHHLFPNISHVHYKKIAPIVERVAKKHELPYFVQPNFASAIKMHTRMLKSLGREK
ncbi:MAG: acyl-CoA desaturase [Bacteroidetes bacterium]|jgi:linoleoyl-CoA desaturase|nr:acyl-CoA desaturase [Bacteroidota bacterium]